MAVRAVPAALRKLRSGIARWQRLAPGGSGASAAARSRGTAERSALAATHDTTGHADAIDFLTEYTLRQPDATTCGSAALVLARMLADGQLSRQILGVRSAWGTDSDGVQARFAAEVLMTHGRTNRVRDCAGRLQIPWPRALGTLPSAAARYLGGGSIPGEPVPFASPYKVSVVDPSHRERAFQRLIASAGDGYPCPVYVGDGYSPRHVVLALPGSADGRIRYYEPSAGTLQNWDLALFTGPDFTVAGWPQPWLLVAPLTRR
ncbi:MAG: hypothetical protein QOK10_3568 [Pseudonocardiales bacterium]|nr:hypothetical protein [Pseudonocardiales bacterium]